VFIPCPGGAGPLDRIYKTGDLARCDAGGLFYFLGRADTQIKHRGYRIELGEIESALHALPQLRESAIVAIQSGGFEGWQICCAYVPAAADGVSLEGLRKALADQLPVYMLPTRWMRYDDALPKNESGKIDRPRLKEGFLSSEPPLPQEPAAAFSTPGAGAAIERTRAAPGRI